jgi:hypothetical protein
MRSGSSSAAVGWVIAGLAVLAFLAMAAWHFREDPARQLASKASRADLVGRMQLALASASEAEKSAVLAVTDQDSQAFADQARAATGDVERERQELARLLSTAGTPRERELAAEFAQAFDALRRTDDQLLPLAVKNSNLKASALLFGPAAEALAELDGALARLVARRADSPAAARITLLASGARIGALRIQTLLAPHIAEASGARMAALEAAMSGEEAEVRRDLDGLAGAARLAGDPDLTAAVASFGRYAELEARILALSRENTNVQSLALSLDQKRRQLVVCLAALSALKDAILEEPIAGVSAGARPTR